MVYLSTMFVSFSLTECSKLAEIYCTIVFNVMLWILNSVFLDPTTVFTLITRGNTSKQQTQSPVDSIPKASSVGCFCGFWGLW